MRWLTGGGLRRHLSIAVLGVGLVALASPGHAQVLYGSIIGNVEDSTGAVVPGATVTITSEATNLSRETVTTATGGFNFVNVQSGSYTVRVSLAGFKERVQTGVPVRPNAGSRVDLVMEVGELTEVITVESERALLQTDSGELSAELESEEITQMPLNAYRNYEALINLVPGATPARFQNAVADTPARSLTTNVNGAARNNNNAKIDGTGAVFVWLPHHAIYVPPADTIETVNVSTASFDAEQGMSGGAAVSVQTKSGTNEFHGSGFWLHENSSLAARAWENSGEKPDSKRNIAGGTLGGPIVKEKVFFFAGYEGTFEETPFTRVESLPTAALRAGDFSGTGTTIYDPLTGDPATGEGRTPFPGNIIPAGRIHPTAAQILGLTPLPNGDGFTSNYTTSGLEKLTRHNYDMKLNYHFSPATQVWAKYSRMDADVTNPARFGEIGGGGISGAAGGCDTKVQIGTVGFTWTASPNLVVDGTAGGAYFDQSCFGDDQGTNWGTDVFGIPGTNGDGGSLGDIRASGLPRFDFSGFSDLGNVNGWSPLFRNDRTYTASANATLIQGDHEIRFGGNVERLELTHWQPELGPGPRGTLSFGGGVTALNGGASPNEFNSMATFLLGLTSSVGKSVQHELFTGREWQIGFYVRDRWQVNQKLTLNLGLRIERYPIMTRETRNLEIYDPSTNIVTLNPSNQPDVKLPAILPRVGFAYRLTDSDVIRAGFGTTVSGTPFSRPLRGFFPQVVAADFVTPNAFVPFGTFDTGIPLFFGPAEGIAEAEVPTSAAMGSARPDEVNRSYIKSWNVTYERKLPGDISLATSYVGTQTKNQMGFININASDAGQGQNGQPLFQAFGRTSGLSIFDGHWDADYHALQVALNKPFSDGLFLKGAYTWGKAINETDDDGWAGTSWNSASQLSRNRARAGYDQTHIFQLGFVAELPLGESPVLDGWQLSGTFSAFSGRVGTVTASGASLNARGNTQTADQVGPLVVLGGIGRDNPYYDPASFVPVTEVRYGNVGRNTVPDPGWWNLDLVLSRNFRLNEKINLQARVEAYNVTNTPHFNGPNRNASSSSFMTITSTSTNARNRQLRLGMRLSF